MINIDDYRHLKDSVIKQIEKKGFGSIAEFCAMTGVPLIAAYTYVMEDYEELKEKCELKIKGIKEFYGI